MDETPEELYGHTIANMTDKSRWLVKANKPAILRLCLNGRGAFIVQSIEEILESFSLIDDWEGRYSLLIDLGKKLPDFPEHQRIDANLVKGCVSRVWMIPSVKDGIFTFDGDSDAHIVRGLVGLLHIIYSGQPVENLKAIDIKGIFEKLGLEQNLSPNRRNGLNSMVEKIRSFS